MTILTIDRSRTAIVVIDLQKSVAALTTMPYSVSEVVVNAGKLVRAFRKNGMPVFLVHTDPEPGTVFWEITDETAPRPPWPRPAEAADFVPEMTPAPADVVIMKRQWGAFYGTDLDLRLRRGGLDTIVLCGIATDVGVESTARFANEYGYQQIFAEDAMAALSKEQHDMAIKYVFRQLGRIRKTGEILAALE